MSMLTIKHVEKSGFESIQMAHSVWTEDDQNADAKRQILVASGCTALGGATGADGICRYGSGTVYVMNDAGATVGKYHFD